MSDRIEIRLSEVNEEAVSLKSLSPEALDSFMTVMSSLKSIAVSINDDLRFKITEGSAVCAVEPKGESTLKVIYNEMDEAIKGNSEDKQITSSLRKIQEQLMRENFVYDFTYKNGKGKVINMTERLVKSSRIRVKSSKKPYEYRLKVVNGFLNQIGGKDPNYHFDYGHNDKLTIVCSKNEAIEIKKYLYQSINSLLVCKEWADLEKRNEYTHKLVIDDGMAATLKSFLRMYYQESDLVNRLTLLHDFIDENFDNTSGGYEFLKMLLIAFNHKNFHVSELKTLLVKTKAIKNNEHIRLVRKELFETYQAIRRRR